MFMGIEVGLSDVDKIEIFGAREFGVMVNLSRAEPAKTVEVDNTFCGFSLSFHIVHSSMNYMEKQDLKQLQHLSTQVGNFIRYWGFRNIHGQIWTVVYLSKEPLSGVEIGSILKVSKALISPALKELETEGLIFQVESENSKTKRYRAEEDVAKIIRDVLSRRELPMIDEVQKSFSQLKGDSLNPERVDSLGGMIQMAQVSLAAILTSL